MFFPQKWKKTLDGQFGEMGLAFFVFWPFENFLSTGSAKKVCFKLKGFKKAKRKGKTNRAKRRYDKDDDYKYFLRDYNV